MIDFSYNQELEIIKDYTNGMRWEELYKKFNCSSKPIYKILKKYNISKRRITNTETWNTEKLDLLKDMYLRNCTYKEMYSVLNCKGGTLTYWVKKLNLPMRGSGRNNVFNNPFLNNSSEKDYWLGYLFADGHIDLTGITLTTNNITVANAFNKFCGNICKIYTRNYKIKSGEIRTMYWPKIISKTLGKWFLEKYQIDTKKHHTLNPNIDINWNIVRGYFDGDGNAHLKGGFTLTSCSLKWLERIQEFFTNNNIVSSLSPSYKDCYKLSVWRKSELYKLVPLLYKEKTFFIDYKYNRLEPYISNNIVKTE